MKLKNRFKIGGFLNGGGECGEQTYVKPHFTKIKI